MRSNKPARVADPSVSERRPPTLDEATDVVQRRLDPTHDWRRARVLELRLGEHLVEYFLDSVWSRHPRLLRHSANASA